MVLINLHRNLHEKSSFLSEIMFIRINPYLCHLLTRYQSTIFPNHKSCVRKKGVPRKEELFYCLFPSGSADTPETRGRSTHTACRRSGIHNSFPADFNGRSRFRRPLIRYAPKHPRKGFRGKVEIHRTIAAGPCITGHRKTRVQGFCRKRTFPFAESIYYT